MDRTIIRPERIRKIEGGFGFIEHRFVHAGYLHDLSKEEILLYFFLAVVSDKFGISFYGTRRSLSLLKLEEGEYYRALAGLEQKDYIVREGNKIQLLSLPELPDRSVAVSTQRTGCTVSIGEILQGACHGQG